MARIANSVDVITAGDRAVLGRGWMLAVAWATTLLVSRLPEIVLREGFGVQTDWMSLALIGAVTLLWLASGIVATLRPLRSYFGVMAAVTLLLAVIPLILDSDAWRALVPPTAGEMAVLLAERVLFAVLALVVIGLLLVMRTRPADAYLVPGSVSARSRMRIPGTAGPLRWTIAGPLWIVILAGLTALAMLGAVPPASATSTGASLPARLARS